AVYVVFFFQAEDGIRDDLVTGVQTCALPILGRVVRRQDLARWREARAERRGVGAAVEGVVHRAPHTHVVEGRDARIQEEEERPQIGRASCRERVQRAEGAGAVQQQQE